MKRLQKLFTGIDSIRKTRPTMDVFVPLFILLTFIAAGNTLQAIQAYRGEVTSAVILNYCISKTFYSWYYFFLAILIQQLSIRLHLTRAVMSKWLAIHIVVLVASISLHQLLLFWVDILTWEETVTVSYTDLLIKNIAVWLDVTIYIFLVLGFYMLEYRRIHQENEIKYSHLESQLLRLQLQELRSLIHPQFLFRTLDSIEMMLDRNQNKEANRLLTLLSSVLRTNVYESECEERTLEQELSYMRTYLTIENVRFTKGMVLEEEIEEEVFQAMIPSLILQPVIERYIEHALIGQNSLYMIYLSARKNNQQLSLHVEDNSVGTLKTGEEQEQDDVACRIIEDRLSDLYHGNQLLRKTKNENGGMAIEIQIPFRVQPSSYDQPVIMERV